MRFINTVGMEYLLLTLSVVVSSLHSVNGLARCRKVSGHFFLGFSGFLVQTALAVKKSISKRGEETKRSALVQVRTFCFVGSLCAVDALRKKKPAGLAACGQIQSMEELEETGAILPASKITVCFISPIRDI